MGGLGIFTQILTRDGFSGLKARRRRRFARSRETFADPARS
jgi:hypothetical protein